MYAEMAADFAEMAADFAEMAADFISRRGGLTTAGTPLTGPGGFGWSWPATDANFMLVNGGHFPLGRRAL
jgi:hypothetical protein